MWSALAGRGDVWKNLIRLFQSTHFSGNNRICDQPCGAPVEQNPGGSNSCGERARRCCTTADDPQWPLRATTVQYAALPSGYLAALCSAPAQHRPVGSAAPVPIRSSGIQSRQTFIREQIYRDRAGHQTCFYVATLS